MWCRVARHRRDTLTVCLRREYTSLCPLDHLSTLATNLDTSGSEFSDHLNEKHHPKIISSIRALKKDLIYRGTGWLAAVRLSQAILETTNHQYRPVTRVRHIKCALYVLVTDLAHSGGSESIEPALSNMLRDVRTG